MDVDAKAKGGKGKDGKGGKGRKLSVSTAAQTRAGKRTRKSLRENVGSVERPDICPASAGTKTRRAQTEGMERRRIRKERRKEKQQAAWKRLPKNRSLQTQGTWNFPLVLPLAHTPWQHT
eukprot:3216047-Amphidinium_carterae.2